MGNPHKHEYFNKLKKHYLKKGYDIFALAMSDRGYNKISDMNFLVLISQSLGMQYSKISDPKYQKKKP